MKISGYGVWSWDDGKVEERDSLNCVHCGFVWWVKPGSGNQRGFCLLCMAPTCGSEACETCVPFEKKLAAEEHRGKLFQVLGIA